MKILSRGRLLAIAFALSIIQHPVSLADFKLPIALPVEKIISIGSDMEPDTLKRFSMVKNLHLEIRMLHGNLIPGRISEILDGSFKETPKKIVLTGDIREIHTRQIRRLPHTEVQYDPGSRKIDDVLVNRLYSLGPLRKSVVLATPFEPAILERIMDMKYTSLLVSVGQQQLSKEEIELLSRDRKKIKTFSLPPTVTPENIYDLTVISPLRLEIRTKCNRLDDKLLKALGDLTGVDITLVVNGRLTIEDVRKFAHLERFKLKILLDRGSNVIPGLAQLLNRVGPP